MDATIISRGTGRECPVDFSARIKKKLVSHPLLKPRSEKRIGLILRQVTKSVCILTRAAGPSHIATRLALGMWISTKTECSSRRC